MPVVEDPAEWEPGDRDAEAADPDPHDAPPFSDALDGVVTVEIAPACAWSGAASARPEGPGHRPTRRRMSHV
jgi:hypothetical protein